MLQDYSLLRIPGPTPVPPSVQSAMAKPMIGHRGEEATELLQRIRPRVKQLFGTEQDIITIAGSGTAGLETAVVNTVSSNDEVLVIVTGAFGDRFAKICEAYHIKTHRLDVPWGEAISPEVLEQYLKNHQNIKAVFMTHCETSTGVLNPIASISKTIHENSNALVIVDAVSSLGGVKTEMDEWGVDLLVTGSQKAMMLPPGLTLLGVSDRAWKVIESNEHGCFYFDLQTYRKNVEGDKVPYTPAIPLLLGLDQALNLIEAEGLEEVYRRHEVMKDMTRAAMKALNVPLLTEDEYASPTVTALKPTTFQAEELRKIVKSQFNLSLAGGQQHLSGKVFRIGHMGYCAPADVLQVISLIEIGLIQLGESVTPGAGVKSAQEVLLAQINK